tara:strand:+ start:650 stop:856 length:207 start_codon:yes stop_codon:yes gene_type:complete
MDEIIDLIATDSSSSDVSDKIKDLLYTKAADKIESQRADVAMSMFNQSEPEVEDETTVEPEEETQEDG